MSKKPEDLQEFKELFNLNYQNLCNRVQRITNDIDVAEDIVQEVFINFWNNDKRPSIQRPEAYLHKAAIHKALNFVVCQKRKKELNMDYMRCNNPVVTGFGQELEYLELQQKVEKSLNLLPPMCKKVFLLSRYEEMSHKEIADFLKISPNTVDNHIKKALQLLRKALLALLILVS